MAAAAEITTTIDRARASAICEKIRENMTSARDLLVELYDGRGWEALGYSSWRECASAEFGEHQRTLYRQLEAAKVVRELEAASDSLSFDRSVNKSDRADATSLAPSDIPETQLVALAKAPEGTRAEVLDVATEAADGKPTERTVKAAVRAKKAKPEASPAELVEDVKTLVNGVAKADPAIEKARAAGRIPANVVVEVEDPGEEATSVEDVAEAHAERAAKVDEITDDEWLARLPAFGELTGLAKDRFKLDALHYRRLESKRRGLKQLNGSILGELFSGTTWRGHVHAALSYWLRVQHPERWRKCSAPEKGGCDGAGVVPVYGGDCSVCKGKGYIAR